MPKKLISLKNVSYVQGQKTILEDVSFDIFDKQTTTIIGPNGAGKTSLLRLILGLEKPTSGLITRHTKVKIGYMPQKLMVNQSLPMTVEGFLALSLPRRTTLNIGLIQRFNLEKILSSQIHTLSGGELQRTLLARALMLDPDLLVLDEPAQGLDINGQIEFYTLLAQVSKETRLGILLVSHDLHLVFAKSHHVLCLNKHLCCSGHPEVVKSHANYKALFEHDHDKILALYQHHHDHEH